jgi:hypothetical protein
MSTTHTPAHTPPSPRRLTLRRESLRELTTDALRDIAGGRCPCTHSASCPK